MAPTEQPQTELARRNLSRRELLTRAAVVGAVGWAAPVLSSVRIPAFAVSGVVCVTGTYAFRLNSNGACEPVPASSNPTACLGDQAAGALDGCPLIVSATMIDELHWEIIVRGTVSLTSLQCNGFRTHACTIGSPDGVGIDVTDNGDGTSTVRGDCVEGDPHDKKHGITHMELLFSCP